MIVVQNPDKAEQGYGKTVQRSLSAVASGNHLVVSVMGWSSGGTPSISDSAGGSWGAPVHSYVGTNETTHYYLRSNVTSGLTWVRATYPNDCECRIGAIEVSGGELSLDGTPGGTAQSSTSSWTFAFTSTADDALFVGFGALSNGATATGVSPVTSSSTPGDYFFYARGVFPDAGSNTAQVTLNDSRSGEKSWIVVKEASTGSAGNATSGLAGVTTSAATASATGAANATASLDAISLAPANASAAGSASASAGMAAVSMTPAQAGATGAASASAVLDGIDLTPANATASGGESIPGNATVSLAPVSLTAAQAIASGAATAAGPMVGIGLTPAAASAAGAAWVAAELALIALEPAHATAEGDYVPVYASLPSGSGATRSRPATRRPARIETTLRPTSSATSRPART